MEDGERTGYCYNKKNQLVSRETKKGRWTYRYDRQGNLTEETGTDGSWEYHYDPLNRQEMIGRPDGSKIRNLYDGEGLRAEKQVNGKSSRFLFLNGEILSEMDESQKPVSHYVRGYGVAAVGSGKEYNAVHQDESGSTVYMTGSGQEIHNSYEYDAFGVVTRRNEAVPNQILYTGQQYDQESGQYYLRARFYNPVIGRFLQEDVYRGDGLNLYAYCENNPVVYYDPSGYNKTQKPNGQNSQGPNATEEVNSERVFSTEGSGQRTNDTIGLGQSTSSQGYNPKGYNPEPGERTFEGYVNRNVPQDVETKLYTNSTDFNTNPKNDGHFKRFGTEPNQHGIEGSHVHQPTRNINPNNGIITGKPGSKTKNDGVTVPGAKDVKQLYEYLNNGKYHKR